MRRTQGHGVEEIEGPTVWKTGPEVIEGTQVQVLQFSSSWFASEDSWQQLELCV